MQREERLSLGNPDREHWGMSLHLFAHDRPVVPHSLTFSSAPTIFASPLPSSLFSPPPPNPTYFRSNFCSSTSSAGQTAPEEAQPSANNPETEGDGEGFWSFLWGSKRPGRSEHASGMGASHGEGTPKGAPPPGPGTQRTRRLLFHEKFRWHTHHVRAIQADRILAEKRRRGWFSDYPEAGSNMYLLAPDQVYKVRVLASTVWVPEVTRWEPEVFIIGEGINFTVEDTTRLMQNLHRANVIAEQVGIRLYKE